MKKLAKLSVLLIFTSLIISPVFCEGENVVEITRGKLKANNVTISSEGIDPGQGTTVQNNSTNPESNGSDIIINDEANMLNYDCKGENIIINGDSNNITISGKAANLTVNGDANRITFNGESITINANGDSNYIFVEKTDSINTNGDTNNVVWESGLTKYNPDINNLGTSNRIAKK